MGGFDPGDLGWGSVAAFAVLGIVPLLHKFLGMGNNPEMDPGQPSYGIPIVIES